MGPHIELGHALITLVEPYEDSILSYNRWYEDDHFLAAVLAGPGAFTGRRFVATRELKARRFPDPSPIARPLTNGSMMTLYWIERGQLDVHLEWAFLNADRLAREGRMNPDRDHVSTAYYDVVGHTGRGSRPVAAQLALTHPYDGLVMIWTESTSGGHESWSGRLRDELVSGDSPIGQVVTARPLVFREPRPTMPGAMIGADPSRDVLAHCCFVDRDLHAAWPELSQRLARALDIPGATALLVAPFVPTIPGTDTYMDDLR